MISAILLATIAVVLFVTKNTLEAVFFIVLSAIAEIHLLGLFQAEKSVHEINEPELLKGLANTNSELLKSYQSLSKENYRQSLRFGRAVDLVERKLNGREPVEIFYNLDVDNRKAHEINENLLMILKNNDKFNQSLLDTEIIKGIIKRGHETFYKNGADEFWSKPHGSGGYLIYKKGEFFTEDNQHQKTT